MVATRRETRDGMRIIWNAHIPMDDGISLAADVFLPMDEGEYPAVCAIGPYGKGHFVGELYHEPWEEIKSLPGTFDDSSGKYHNWEVVDPEKWTKYGYAVVRVDERGIGNSPGIVHRSCSDRYMRDMFDMIEWIGTQAWCSGKVGMNGISAYAINGWFAASMNPPHLTALVAWEGLSDNFREAVYHGGIFNDFTKNRIGMQLLKYKYGQPEVRHHITGDPICGDEALSEDERRAAFDEDMLPSEFLADKDENPFAANLQNITIPVLSAGNWGGAGLHFRGNVEGYLGASSKEKWLEVHGNNHTRNFYCREGIEMQKKFLDHYLKGEDNGWEKTPRIILMIRGADGSETTRMEEAWPLPRTRFTPYYLQPNGGLSTVEPDGETTVSFEAMERGLTFITEPFAQNVEFTGPMAAKLRISSSTTDADLFLVVRAFSPEMHEITFDGSADPHMPVAQGWLRASHRKLDADKSLPYRPWHTHDEPQPLKPGEPVDMDVEIWPSCVVIPKGYRLAISVRGRDYECAYGDELTAGLSHLSNKLKGCGGFIHTDPENRPMDRFSGTTTLHFAKGSQPYILMPVVPPKDGE